MSDNEAELGDEVMVDDEDVNPKTGALSAKVLLDLLSNKEYNKFKSTIDLPRNLADTDDLEVICRTSKEKVLSKMLFYFVSSLAGESMINLL